MSVFAVEQNAVHLLVAITKSEQLASLGGFIMRFHFTFGLQRYEKLSIVRVRSHLLQLTHVRYHTLC